VCERAIRRGVSNLGVALNVVSNLGVALNWRNREKTFLLNDVVELRAAGDRSLTVSLCSGATGFVK